MTANKDRPTCKTCKHWVPTKQLFTRPGKTRIRFGMCTRYKHCRRGVVKKFPDEFCEEHPDWKDYPYGWYSGATQGVYPDTHITQGHIQGVDDDTKI